MRPVRGFTLLELMVVVTIIAVIISAAVPQYSLYVDRARSTEALIQVETIAYLEQVRILELGEPIACSKNPNRIPGATPTRFEIRPDWEDLGLRIEAPVYFQYAVSTSASGHFTVTAEGHLGHPDVVQGYQLSSTDMRLRPLDREAL